MTEPLTESKTSPGDGPLFGKGSAFAPHALEPRLRAREARRLETVLAEIEARGGMDHGENPPLRAVIDALRPTDRERLLLTPDFRRWLARLIGFLNPQREEGLVPMPTIQVQAVWNQLAIPWLRSPGSERGSRWLQVYGDGRVPFPGSGLTLAQGGGGQRVRLMASGEMLRFDAENGATIASIERQELLAAADGSGPAPAGFIASCRLPGTSIEVVGASSGTGASEAEPQTGARASLEAAASRLAGAWPAGHELVTGLTRRIQLDPNSDLNSRTASELPGVIILGSHQTLPAGIAELLVHEAAHLLVYEVARLTPVLPAPREIRRSPWSREGKRPAYMVLHATASFLAQAIATLRFDPDRARITPVLADELERLDEGEGELCAHLAAHAAEPHPFLAALFAEVSLLRQAVRRNQP